MVKIRDKNLEKFTGFLRGLGFLLREIAGENRRVKRKKGRGRPKILKLSFHAYHLIGPLMNLNSEEWVRSHRVVLRAYFKANEKAFLSFALSPVPPELFTSPPFALSDLRFLGIIRSLKKAPDFREKEVPDLKEAPFWFDGPTYDRMILGWLEDMVRLPVGTLIISALPFGFTVVARWEIGKVKQSLDAFDYLLNELDMDASEWEKANGEDHSGLDLLEFFHRLAPYIMEMTDRCIYCGKRILQAGKRERFFCSKSHNIAFKIHLRKYAHNYPDLRNLSRQEIMKRFRELGFEETKRRYPLLVARR